MEKVQHILPNGGLNDGDESHGIPIRKKPQKKNTSKKCVWTNIQLLFLRFLFCHICFGINITHKHIYYV